MKILFTTFFSFINQPLDSENTCTYSFKRSLKDDNIFSFKRKLVIEYIFRAF